MCRCFCVVWCVVGIVWLPLWICVWLLCVGLNVWVANGVGKNVVCVVFCRTCIVCHV